MTATVVLLVLIGLVVYGIERNHARHRYPRSWLAGSPTAGDRDSERVSADLDAAVVHEAPRAHRLTAVGGRAIRIPSVR